MSKTVRIFALILFIWALSACNLTTPPATQPPAPENGDNAGAVDGLGDGAVTGDDSTTGALGGMIADLQLSVQAVNAGDTFDEVGQAINYAYALQNIGTEAHFGGPVIITDDKATVTCPGLNEVGNNDDLLNPGETITCTGSYNITQADLDAGNVANNATGSVQDGAFLSNTAGTIVTLTQVKGLTLTTAADPTTYKQAGDVITITYVILNSGNVSLGPVQFTVTDSLFGAAFNCGPANSTVQPNGLINCTRPYTVTQADLNASSINSSATATDGTVTSATATETVTNESGTQPTPIPGDLTPGSTIYHVVERGEWLIQIARCYGADYDDVRLANPHIYHPSWIWAGQVITVPDIGSQSPIFGPPCVVFHTVTPGDTWESIALQYNARLDVLRRANPGWWYPYGTVKVPINSAAAPK